MTGRGGDAGDVVVLGESRFWPGAVIPLGVAVVIVGVGVLRETLAAFPLVIAVTAFASALVLRGRAVLADDEGLLVRRGRVTKRSYAWSDIERAGWVTSGWWGTALTVCPRGGPYDVPGPNSPTSVASIWWPRRPAEDPLPGLLRRHRVKALTD